jgi:glycosyltransferase involved in cell wall biosynthesis
LQENTSKIAGFSIVICAHNPAEELLQRLFNSLLKFKVSDEFSYEIILVDSGSSPKLEARDFIKSFLSQCIQSRLVRADKTGLTNARITGVNNSKYDWIVFFDDDNEPENNYLLVLLDLIKLHPSVKIWGPGKITVEYVGFGNIDEFSLSQKELFQQRDTAKTKFENNKWGSEYYPPGSGIVVNVDVLTNYIQKVQDRTFTMSDRNGKNLTSGGDVQIILNAIRMGYFVGSSNQLVLNHLIKKEKLQFKKLLGLNYWLSSSNIKAFNEVFPEEAMELSKIENKQIVQQMYYFLKVDIWQKGWKQGFLDFYKKLGEMNARVLAASDAKQPFLLKILEKMI